MAAQDAIVVQDVAKAFGDVQALAGIDLRVERGSVYGLLGPNGAGKTTLIRILTTLLQPDRGEAWVAGFDVRQERARLREVIGLAGEYAAVEENLTGRENLAMVGQLYHLPRQVARQRADKLLEQFGLAQAADRVTKTYSGGMRRRLDLAASLVGDPQVLFLDEPTIGLDPHSRIALWQHIRALVGGGVTELLTTQMMEEADELTDRIGVIDHGQLIASGAPDELKAELGSDVLELRIEDNHRLEEAAAALAPYLREEARLDEVTGSLSAPLSDGGRGLIDVVHVLDDIGLEVVNLNLRRPTLNEVFLALTGEEALQARDTVANPQRMEEVRS